MVSKWLAIVKRIWQLLYGLRPSLLLAFGQIENERDTGTFRTARH